MNERINEMLDTTAVIPTPLEMFCTKSCSRKFRQFLSKTPVSKSIFNKVAGLQA